MHENAQKYSFFKDKISKFSKEVPRHHPCREGDTPSPNPTPLDAFDLLTSPPSAARCPSSVCWCSSSWLGLAMRLIFGRPFVKRFALCYRTVVCHVCVRLGSSPPPEKKNTAVPHTFRPMSVVAKRLDGSRCHLVRR